MIHRSRYPDTALPAQSLSTFFRERVAGLGDRVALVDGPSGRSYTFAQLLALSASAANALHARGIGRGDRVAFVTPNVPEVAIAFHGVVAAGATAMMLNPLSTPDELKKYFQLGAPKLVVTVAPFVESLRQAAPETPLIVIGDAVGPGVEPVTALLKGPAQLPNVDVQPVDDVAVMPFSSGTTGFPKGVMLTHRNIIAQCMSLAAMEDAPVVPLNSRAVAVLPFFHIYGIIAFLTHGLTQGATIITMPRFDMAQYLELVRKHSPEVLHVVPPILLGLAKLPGELQLPGVKNALAGAAPLSEALANEFTQRTGVTVSQVYGMTEVTGASHLGSRSPGKRKPGSIGGVIANVETKIVDGEIWVKGPIVMKGYFQDPEATAALIDADGWLHTGDIGHTDGDGDFFVVDRVKELIKYKGMQVAPAELEAVLLSHEAVADAAVYGVGDAEAGEIPKAAVVLKAGKAATADELIQFVGGRVAPHKRVRALKVVAQIPKSASGKILRRVLVAEG
jgi:acyl-CoA synthetase (AMP-forming)/AMP-acid ligase II